MKIQKNTVSNGQYTVSQKQATTVSEVC